MMKKVSLGCVLEHTEDQPQCADPTCPCKGPAPSGPVLAVGMIAEKTIEWLEEHGATIIDGGVVTIVLLPEWSIVDNDRHWWSYTVTIFDENGDEVQPGLVLDHAVDARHSLLGLRKAKVA